MSIESIHEASQSVLDCKDKIESLKSRIENLQSDRHYTAQIDVKFSGMWGRCSFKESIDTDDLVKILRRKLRDSQEELKDLIIKYESKVKKL